MLQPDWKRCVDPVGFIDRGSDSQVPDSIRRSWWAGLCCAASQMRRRSQDSWQRPKGDSRPGPLWSGPSRRPHDPDRESEPKGL